MSHEDFCKDENFILYIMGDVNMTEKMVIIKESEYNRLLDKAEFLNCLEACGVDNWNGYDDARDMMNEEEEEDDEDEDYEVIECSECLKEKRVEKGTWALEEGMCEQCYCEYQGG